MRATTTIGLLTLIALAVPAGPARAQDRPIELSGNASVGYTSSKDTITTDPANPLPEGDLTSMFRELDLSLDLHTGTFILSPRFIAITADVRLSTLKGHYGDADNGNNVQGQTYTVSVLRSSAFPFRFLYSREDSGYSQLHSAIYSSENSEMRMDWQLKLRNLPQLAVSYDSRTNKSGAFDNPNQITKNRGITITGQDSVFGWDIHGAFEHRSADYAVTGLGTTLTTMDLDGYKAFSQDSHFTIHGSRQIMDFTPTDNTPAQKFSFLDVRTQYDARITKKLTFQAYNQSYSSTTEQQTPVVTARPNGLFSPTPELRDMTAGASFFEAQPEGTFAVPPPVLAGTAAAVPAAATTAVTSEWTGLFTPSVPEALAPVAPVTQISDTSTRSMTFGGLVSYNLIPTVTIGGGTSVSFIRPPETLFESATRQFDAVANVAWGQRIGFVSARANASYGYGTAVSDLGNRGSAPYYTIGSGLTVGNPQRVLVWVDANRMHRDDIFFDGGYANDTAYTVGFETQLLPSLRVTGMAGYNTYDNLNAEGYDYFNRVTYGFGVEHRLVAFHFSKNVSVGNRDIFSVPFEVTSDRLFFQLPVDTLIPDPLERTRTAFTQAVLRFNLARNLDLEARYTRNESDFVEAEDSHGRQFEVVAGYHLGKFTFRAGALLQRLEVEDSPTRDRVQYFFRVSRAFRIF
jgi:hypothetical protein